MTLDEVARLVNGTLHGDPNARVCRVAPLDAAEPEALSYCKGKRFSIQLQHTRAGAVLIPADLLQACPVPAIVVEDPYVAYARAAQALHPPTRPRPGVHPTAVISNGARVSPKAEVAAGCIIGEGALIEDDCIIGPGCTIGAGATIGRGSRLIARVVVLDHCRIGARCTLHPGCVIGADGFGFARGSGEWIKIPQLGAVRIGDDCEIGANTCVDRGALHDTIIGHGVKIDNLVQIGHNVVIGDHSIIVAGVLIGGSTRIGDSCALGGGSGCTGHLEIAPGTEITAMSLVTGDLREPGRYSSSISVQDARRWRRNLARLHRLDETVRRLQDEISFLKNTSAETED